MPTVKLVFDLLIFNSSDGHRNLLKPKPEYLGDGSANLLLPNEGNVPTQMPQTLLFCQMDLVTAHGGCPIEPILLIKQDFMFFGRSAELAP